MNRRESILAALFLDLPFLVDSFWRKFEYEANRNHVYRIDADARGRIEPRQLWRTAHFIWFLLLVLFVAFGPTHAPLCQAGGDTLPRVLYGTLALAALAAASWFVLYFGRLLIERGRERLLSCNASRVRRRTLFATLVLFVTVGTLACVGAALNLSGVALQPSLCETGGWSWRSVALLFSSAAAMAIAVWFGRGRAIDRFWLRVQPLLTIGLVCLAWFAIAHATAREADGLPYRHTYALIAGVMFFIAFLAAMLARQLMKQSAARLSADFKLALRHTELFVQRGEPDLSVHRVWHAIVNGAVYQPFLLLLLPSMIAIVVPDRFLYGSWAAAFLFSLLLLAWGSISKRWQQMVLYVRRWFLSGMPFAVSILVIVLAAARLTGNQYVATVLAAAPFGAIFIWIVMIYCLLWLYEHVVNQGLGTQLLTLLSSEQEGRQGITPYRVENLEHARVSAEDRYLTLHGAGRFAVIGKYPTAADPVSVFHTYGYTELFAALAANGALLERTLQRPNFAHTLAEGAQEIERRTKLYLNVVNAGVIATLAGLAIYSQHHDRTFSTASVVTAHAQYPRAEAFKLADALAARAREGRPALIVAASGGGSRAALYTASALEGLAQLNVAQDIVLVSGVSGGGVALADFAMNRDDLLNAASVGNPRWGSFKKRLSQPFIQDVIEGAMEWRLIGETPLSSLLVESFERELNERQLRLGNIEELGLILNTSISGHPPEDSVVLSNAITPSTSQTSSQCTPYSYLSGSRLAFTNLQETSAFPRFRDSRLPDVDFPYVLAADPGVSVAAAAALNANFPPVFPNARVDILDRTLERCAGRRSYYVTDGGATENLGLISALYALHSALAQWPAEAPLPQLHVIALEASAADFDYRQDRGVGTATGGAKERLAGGLTESLLRSLQTRVEQLGANKDARLHVHYLAMPLALRSRGGIGTHWMLANDILVTNPHRATPVSFLARALAIGPGASDRVRITREELFDLLDAMHAPDGSLCSKPRKLSRSAQKVSDWICNPDAQVTDIHIQEWARLVSMFGQSRQTMPEDGGLALTPGPE
jgi:hypothetical protein